MFVWLIVIVIVVGIGYGLWRFGKVADRIEDESAGIAGGSNREPYGSKWLAIFGGTNKDEHHGGP